MKKAIGLYFVLSLCGSVIGQGIGVGTAAPDASAALDISSTTKGMLVPRLTSDQRELIISPAQGLLVFDITTETFWFHNTNEWVELVDKVNTEVHRTNPDQIYLGLTDSVGIGTLDPKVKLQVKTSNDQYGISHTNGDVDIATFVSSTNSLLGGWIGTRSDHPLNLFAGDGYNQFTMLPNGNIGLGLINPFGKLHVVGNSYFNGNIVISGLPNNRLDIIHGLPRSGTHPDDRAMYVSGNFGAASNGIEFRHSNGTQGIGFGFNTMYATGSSFDQDLGLAAKGSGSLIFTAGFVERMRIGSNGFVGIGTTTPRALLHFPNTQTAKKLVLYEAADNGNQFSGFGSLSDVLRYQVHSSGSSHIFYAGTSPTTSSELMRIQGNGNVGVGITPTNRMDIHTGFGRTGSSHPTGLALYVTGGEMGESSGGIEFRHSSGLQGIGFGYNTIYATGSNAQQDLKMTASGNLIFKSGGQEALRMETDGEVVMSLATVTSALNIGYEQVWSDTIMVPGSGGTVTMQCNCPPGTKVISGGYSSATQAIHVFGSYATTDTQWWFNLYNSAFVPVAFSGFAICARLGS